MEVQYAEGSGSLRAVPQQKQWQLHSQAEEEPAAKQLASGNGPTESAYAGQAPCISLSRRL